MPNFAPKTIWTGDNLPIMRGMDTDSVDLIYLDPPFNSNRNYTGLADDAEFRDIWTLDDVTLEEHGELAERAPAAHQLIQSARLIDGKGMQAYLVFMATRLLEMHRILKPTGQIFLHCDDAACNWLKALMAAVFGKDAYQNIIVWQRSKGMNSGKKKVFMRIADYVLHYAMPEAELIPAKRPHDPEYLRKNYRFTDARGRYRLDKCSAPALSPTLQFEWNGYQPHPNGWEGDRAHMQRLHDENRLHYPTHQDGSPDYSKRVWRKKYLEETKGRKVGNIWSDVGFLSGSHKERTGYPTQKPLPLLERIIKAASKEGDMVFDPFCGCATTLVAADRLNRDWVGIDLCETAVEMVKDRIRADGGMHARIRSRTAPPRRSGGESLPDYRTHKHALYGIQEGHCAGCGLHVEAFKLLTVDHVTPQADGGGDEIENLQLLCGHCNSSKNDRDMATWRAWKRKEKPARHEAEETRLAPLKPIFRANRARYMRAHT